ncbi:DUF7269 family protein [Halostella litorea]|uniref:DUF7269 family protein n=1 Tax=Halostella litorea TaxID=2528831 RepID=UPI001091B274|nr:hypothetical protein [Halostella litorea]
MSRLRTLVAGFGLLAAAAGFVFVFVPSAAAGIGLTESIVVAVGFLALLQGYRVVSARRRSSTREFETPDPETRQELPTPGDGFDEGLAARKGRGWAARRHRVGDRLEEAAVDAITYAEDCSEATAREMLEAGTWTDDPQAAAMFSTGRPEGSTLWRRLRETFSMEPTFDRRARRAAHAVADLRGVDDRPEGESE